MTISCNSIAASDHRFAKIFISGRKQPRCTKTSVPSGPKSEGNSRLLFWVRGSPWALRQRWIWGVTTWIHTSSLFQEWQKCQKYKCQWWGSQEDKSLGSRSFSQKSMWKLIIEVLVKFTVWIPWIINYYSAFLCIEVIVLPTPSVSPYNLTHISKGVSIMTLVCRLDTPGLGLGGEALHPPSRRIWSACTLWLRTAQCTGVLNQRSCLVKRQNESFTNVQRTESEIKPAHWVNLTNQKFYLVHCYVT